MAGFNAYNYGQPQYSWSQPTPATNYFAWVQGEAAAQAFQVAPGSTVMLMDSENPVLYMKSADNTGRPSPMQKMYLVSEEDYNKIQNEPKNSDFVTKEDLQKAIDEINTKFVIRKEYRNGKSSV